MQVNRLEPQTAAPQTQANLEFRRLLDKLPAAAYTTDAEGLITYFNQRAAETWGREPRLNDPVDRF
jgi:PAS domain-containing protein